MGYMRHNAIIVTSWLDTLIESAHAKAEEIFGERNVLDEQIAQVSPVTAQSINGFRSFFVAPDGSKEGWDVSDRGDEGRAQFVQYLQSQVYEDHSSPLDWVEIQYGDENLETKVVNDSDDVSRACDGCETCS